MNKNSPQMGGQGGRSQIGSGGGPGPAPPAGESPKDETKESPPAKEADDLSRDNLAPEGQPQSDLVLRGLSDLLKDPDAVKALEDHGISRSEAEQWARNYEKKAGGAPSRAGTDINVKPGEQSKAQPAPDLPRLDPKMPFSNKNVRNRGTMPHDDFRENLEGIRFEPPPQYRSKWEAFKDRISKVAAPKRAGKPGSKP
jgi:hypothetical protein